jgi:di/tricarboxylate transporter
LAVGIFASAILALGADLVTAPVAFVGASLLMLLTRLITLREAYASVEWPIIVLLAALIPVGTALEVTGGAALVAKSLLAVSGFLSPQMIVWIVLIAAMALTPMINNAAAAILLAPIGLNLARSLGVSPDPFLMAVCVGCSCDFLTPIGHQSNTLVMGPGGYKFGDYTRMGIFIEVIIAVTAAPLILWFWPLHPAGG